MRILILSPRAHVRGSVGKMAPLLVDALRRAGCSVVLEAWGRHRDRERTGEKLFSRSRDIARVRRRLSSGTFDVLVITTAHDWATLARDVSLVIGVRRQVETIALQFQGSDPDRLLRPGGALFKALTRALLRRVDGAMVLSSEEREKWGQFDPELRLYEVRNPFVPAAGVAQPSRSAGHAVEFLFVGRLMREKGVIELLEAFASVRRESPCRLTVVGEGPARAQLEGEVATLGLTESVSFRDYLVGDDLASAYGSADVFVLPSWSEGFPTVIAEAMSHGLPIVTTRIRGAADHLVELEHALFVAVRDVEGLTGAMRRLAHDPELRERLGTANRERIKIFDPDVVAAEYIDALRALVTRAGESTAPAAAPR